MKAIPWFIIVLLVVGFFVCQPQADDRGGFTVSFDPSSVNWLYVCLTLGVLSFPLHLYMMRNEVGWYNNDPNHQWGSDSERGPIYMLRLGGFILSPAIVPLNAMYALMRATGKQG